MATLETIARGAAVKGILPDGLATISDVRWIGAVAIGVTYKESSGRLGDELLYRDREPTLEIVETGRPWSFDGGGALFRLLSEANRIRLAYLFDPLLAVHTSLVEPLPQTLAMEHAAIHLVPQHLNELRQRKEEMIVKTMAAVQERLTKEINYWDHRAAQLKDQELGGRINAKLNSGLARQRADGLTGRLQKRLAELEQERKLAALPPVVLGGAMNVPVGLLRRLSGAADAAPTTFAVDTERSERLAMEAVMAAERRLGFVPRDISDQNLGYDVESSIPGTGLLRFLEVKGRVTGAKTVTITKNEILTALNKPDEFILAVVIIDQDSTQVRYCRTPFEKEPDFKATSVNYDLIQLLAQSREPA
jgi:Domain of unknown function (DUF3883)